MEGLPTEIVSKIAGEYLDKEDISNLSLTSQRLKNLKTDMYHEYEHNLHKYEKKERFTNKIPHFINFFKSINEIFRQDINFLFVFDNQTFYQYHINFIFKSLNPFDNFPNNCPFDIELKIEKFNLENIIETELYIFLARKNYELDGKSIYSRKEFYGENKMLIRSNEWLFEKNKQISHIYHDIFIVNNIINSQKSLYHNDDFILQDLTYFNYDISYEFKILNIKNKSIFYNVNINNNNNNISFIIAIPIKEDGIEIDDIIIRNSNRQSIHLEDIENMLGQASIDLYPFLMRDYFQTNILYTNKNKQNYNDINFDIPQNVFVF